MIGMVACTSAPPEPKLSPPLAEVSHSAWAEAELIGAKVPRSMLMVGHGTSMLPLYASGTVLVIQPLQWEHLRAGMTVVYYKPGAMPLMLVAHVLKARNGAAWVTQGLSRAEPDMTAVTPENYMGVVVAACHRPDSAPAGLAVLQHLAVKSEANCLMRCHVEGSGSRQPADHTARPGLPDKTLGPK
ncbi:MAG: hypothetical protein DUW69_002390 [Verrucomicrobia bacterium]|nr:MAG: hypothetical protein DUW69_002390 [Verrucomicrobiota bacterium]